MCGSTPPQLEDFKPKRGSTCAFLRTLAKDRRFWRLTVFTLFVIAVRTLFRHLDATFPKCDALPITLQASRAIGRADRVLVHVQVLDSRAGRGRGVRSCLYVPRR